MRENEERDEKLSQALRIVEAEFKVPEVNNVGDVNEPYPENSIVDWSNVQGLSIRRRRCLPN